MVDSFLGSCAVRLSESIGCGADHTRGTDPNPLDDGVADILVSPRPAFSLLVNRVRRPPCPRCRSRNGAQMWSRPARSSAIERLTFVASTRVLARTVEHHAHPNHCSSHRPLARRRRKAHRDGDENPGAPRRTFVSPAVAMKKLWFVLLFLAGGVSHEIRNPISCQTISVRQFEGPRRRHDA